MNYELAYTLGFHPWEKAGEHPAFTGQISELLDREEKGNRAPYGRALDVGTGSGRWAVELASRGWQVTGVDIVEKPLRRARLRVEEAGVDVRLVHGDVTGLRAAGVEPGFRLVLDTGTFHGLDDGQREAMAREITSMATPDATVLLLAMRKRKRPLIRGVTREEIEGAFSDWDVVDVAELRARLPALLHLVMRPGARWFSLRRA